MASDDNDGGIGEQLNTAFEFGEACAGFVGKLMGDSKKVRVRGK
jgi:hypothetical protein